MVLQNGAIMKNEKSISLGNFKSIFLMRSMDKDYVVFAMYTESAYIHVKLKPDQLNELVESLQSFQKQPAIS